MTDTFTSIHNNEKDNGYINGNKYIDSVGWFTYNKSILLSYNGNRNGMDYQKNFFNDTSGEFRDNQIVRVEIEELKSDLPADKDTKDVSRFELVSHIEKFKKVKFSEWAGLYPEMSPHKNKQF